MKLRIEANVEVTINAAGRFFRMLDATGVVHTRFTDQGRVLPLTKGMTYESALGWEDIVFVSDTTQIIEFESLLEGRIGDDSFIPGAGAALSTIQGTETYGASTEVTLTTAAATEIAPAASGRKALIVYNPSAATIYLHNSALTTLSAVGIPPGGALLLRSTQAWYGYNSTGADIAVWKCEVT